MKLLLDSSIVWSQSFSASTKTVIVNAKSCYHPHFVIRRILTQSDESGFPGMLGSIGCSKWRWRNCPTAFHDQYRGKEKTAAVTLEAIADQSLWISHAFF